MKDLNFESGLYCVFQILLMISMSTCSVNQDSMSSRQQLLKQIRNYEGTYDPMTSRIAPSSNDHYAITKERLDDIRTILMYPYYDVDIYGGRGDMEVNINTQNTQVNKQLSFLLPFFGFGLNYTWVSLNGYLGFSNAPFNWRTYPLTFPAPNWPEQPDPSFIGPFYSKCNIGQLRPGQDKYDKTPGVYWRLMRDLPSSNDRLAVEIRERLKWDIRMGMVGATIFSPKHAIIVTWKNVTFAGGYVNSDAKHVTNTFQVIVATDEIRTYTIFNYEHMAWTSHTEAGGSADEGQGGVPAFVGFNAGNGTRSYEFVPYSQSLYIRDLPIAGFANGLPGRHIFRIDEVVMAGVCRREENLKSYPLTISPENGNMMGGTMVNVTGPCFDQSYKVLCAFDAMTIEGIVIDRNTAVCIMPTVMYTGYTSMSISINGGPFFWKSPMYIETPLTAPEGVWFTDRSPYEKDPETMYIQWLAGNLTQNANARVTISLWGYREKSIVPEFLYITDLATDVSNYNREKLPYMIDTTLYADNDNKELMDLEMGFIMVNFTFKEEFFKNSEITTVVWSRPIPLAWYFQYQWTKIHGENWEVAICDRWVENDRNLRNFAYEVDRCPCLVDQAVGDKGRFLPDFGCDKDGISECNHHYGAGHCVRSALPNKDGAGQQCCYDRDGYLMMSADQKWAGGPHRAHNLGKTPFDEAIKVPTLSHWYHDVIPFYTCCMWQKEQSPGCTIFRFERRVSQDCVGYQPPTAATIFGDPHVYTFDDVEYTFNGLGEFVLVHVDSIRHVLDIQGRFEKIPENYMGTAKGSMLTAVAAQDNTSSVVEVKRRPDNAMWRYHLDVIVDGQRVYFDRYSQKIQQFKGCIVYTPSYVLNQSQVIIMFSSGAGVEVLENKGFLAVRTYLPVSFTNITRGLFGNWTFDPADDFVLPDGSEGPTMDTNNLEVMHEDFGMLWAVDEKGDPNKGSSLFTHDGYHTSSYYYHPNFQPEFDMNPELPPNATTYNVEIQRVCGESYQCHFDYVVTLWRDFAAQTKSYQDDFVNIKQGGLSYVVSCGALPTPPHGRKSSFNFLSGAEVKFDCDPGFVLLGEQRRWCYASGDWNWPEVGEATCVTEFEFITMQNGIVGGLVLAIVIPILIALLCFIAYCMNRVKHNDEKDDEDFTRYSDQYSSDESLTPPIIKSSNDTNSSFITKSSLKKNSTTILAQEDTQQKTFESNIVETAAHVEVQSPPETLQPLGSNSNGRLKQKSRRDSSTSEASSTTIDDSSEAFSGNFDQRKVYYTHEPVNDKPVVFQNVLWGVEDRNTPSPNSYFDQSRAHGTSSSQESAV